MICFTLARASAPSPSRGNLLVRRGYRIVLDPDRFGRHAALAARLRSAGSWSESEWNPSGESAKLLIVSEDSKFKNELLPHQLEAVRRLRTMNQKESSDVT